MLGRSRRPDRFLATILFTDLVGSTDVAVRLGDLNWRRLVAAHNSVVRKQLRKFDGRELDTAGDGFFASFDQPAQAVRAADAIVSEIAALGLAMRVGVHTGEAEQAGAKVGGIAVVIAARIMSAAGAEEVLVSSTVRDLVPGSGLEFDDRGTHELKGVPGEWHIYALRRQAHLPADSEQAHQAAIAAVAALEARSRRRRLVALGAGVLVLVAAIGGAIAFGLGSAPPAALGAPGPNSLVTFDRATGRLVEIRNVAEGPQAAAADGEHVWVAALDAGVLASMPGTGTRDQSTLGRVGRPTDIAIGDNRVWVVDAFTQKIALVDTRNGDVGQTLEIPARHIAFGFDSAWVTNDLTDRVLRLDQQSAAVLSQIDLPVGTYPTALTVGSGAVWVANPGTSTVSRIDPNGNLSAAAIPLRAVPTQISANDTGVWIVSRSSDALLRLDPATNAVASTIADICDQPSSVLATQYEVWVGCAGTNPEVLRVSVEDDAVRDRTAAGGVPTDFAASGDRIYVTVGAP